MTDLSTNTGLFIFLYQNPGGSPLLCHATTYYEGRSLADREHVTFGRGHEYKITAGVVIYAREGQDDLYIEVSRPYTEAFPWHDMPFWNDHGHRALRHMPWFSIKHPGLLVYYQDEAKRAKDIRTPIKPGRYLKKFFSDVLTEEEIHAHALTFSTWSKPPVLTITSDTDTDTDEIGASTSVARTHACPTHRCLRSHDPQRNGKPTAPTHRPLRSFSNE